MPDNTVGYKVLGQIWELMPPIISAASLLLSITILIFTAGKSLRVASESHWSGFGPVFKYWLFTLALLWLFAAMGAMNPFIESWFQTAAEHMQRSVIISAGSFYALPLVIAVSRVLHSYWRCIFQREF